MSTRYKGWTSGLGNIGSYQASSIPYTTSSLGIPGSPSATVVKINFPHVTRFVTIKNIGVEGATDCLLRVGFSEKGIANGIGKEVTNNILPNLHNKLQQKTKQIEEKLVLKQDEIVSEFIQISHDRNRLLRFLLWTNAVTLLGLSFTLGYFL